MKWIVHYSVLIAAILVIGRAQSDTKDDTSNRYGLDVDKPGQLCADIFEKNPSSHGRSGHYLIRTNDLFLAHCDMETENEGKKKGWLKIADIDVSKGDDCPKGWKKTKVNGIGMC